MQKDGAPFAPAFLLLRRIGRAHRTYAGAGTAVDALVRIDHVFAVSFGDSTHGAFRFTSATTDTFVIDNISHGIHLLDR